MRKEYGRALREVFSAAFASACPDFVLAKKLNARASIAGERAYCWVASEKQHMWLVLVPHHNREAFTIELGWSRMGRFPQLSMRPSFARPGEAGSENEYLCRLGELSRGQDGWWAIEDLPLEATQDQWMAYLLAQTKPLAPEIARSRVVPHVQQAVAEFERCGLPLLRAHIQPNAQPDLR